jgi:steroid delta-isomerase-like uncharacterized protein
MSATENKEFIRRYLDAINGKPKTPALVDEYVADSDEALKQHIAGIEATFPCYELEPDDMIAEEDKVTLRFTFRGTYQGGMPGVPAKGQKVESPGIIIYRIAGGKIAEHWMGMDSAPTMQQLAA